MTDDILRYDLMIEAALRDVVRETLATVAQNGLPGEHHFYITFLTNFPGVEIPDYLRKQYQDEMTIVLQYQFFGLKLEDDNFSVTLSFNNVKERLVIPVESITTFADPSVNFALQFQSGQNDEDEDGEDGSARSAPPASSNTDAKALDEKNKNKDKKTKSAARSSASTCSGRNKPLFQQHMWLTSLGLPLCETATYSPQGFATIV